MAKHKTQVVLTGYASRPETLSYFLHEMKSIRESKVFDDIMSATAEGEEETDDREVGKSDHIYTYTCFSHSLVDLRG